MPLAIRADGLVKRFGTTMALDGLALSAEQGRVLGVLGPNGAGKTTAVRTWPPSSPPTPGWTAPRSSCRVGADKAVLSAAVRRLDEAGIALADLGTRRPSLDDVFLGLTGHVAEGGEAQAGSDERPSRRRRRRPRAAA